jgi:hypothetical protein
MKKEFSFDDLCNKYFYSEISPTERSTRGVVSAAGMSESELLYDWRFTANQFIFTTSPLRVTTSNFIFQLNTCRYSPYVTSSLARRCVCRLQLLLVLANAVILRSESLGTHHRNLEPQIRDFLYLEGQVPVFISPRNRVAQLYTQPLGSLFVVSYDSQGYGGGIRPRLLDVTTVKIV